MRRSAEAQRDDDRGEDALAVHGVWRVVVEVAA
jgi:hypothetical protein